MLLVHKWWRKRPYAFHESCRAMQDLQLWYSMVYLLQFKNLEKNPFKQGQMNLNGADRAHVRDVACDAGVAHRPALRSCWTRTPRPDLAHWSMRRGPPLRTAIPALSPVATRHARTGASHRPCRSANRAPLYAPHAVCPCCVRAGTTVVVLRTKALSTAIKEPELSLLRAYVSPLPVCSTAMRH
jgi:hypothetical protein